MMGVAHALQRERIVPFNRETDYLNARQIATQWSMGLPSNVLHDDYLSTDRWRTLGVLYPAWAREVLVYPEKGGKFKIGRDVVDPVNGWIFPACYIPREAMERDKVGLFVDPVAVISERGKVIVHPNPNIKVRMLHPFIQENGNGGKIDPATAIPLDVETSVLKERRYLCRRSKSGVTPIARFTYGHKVSPNHVYANGYPDDMFGVSGMSKY